MTFYHCFAFSVYYYSFNGFHSSIEHNPVIIILGNCYVYASLVLQSNLYPNQYHLKLVIEFVEDVHEISYLIPQC